MRIDFVLSQQLRDPADEIIALSAGQTDLGAHALRVGRVERLGKMSPVVL